MPIYEYQCQQCGHHHEALQKISDPQLRQCPECGRKSDKEAKRNLHDKADKDEAKTDGSGESEAGSKSEAKDAAKSDAKDDSAKSDSAKGDSAKSASSEPTGSGKRSRVSRPATTAVRSKSNGRTKKAARRPPAVRRRGR